MKSILITGGAGFIGSNFIPWFINKYDDYFVVNLDKLTYAGDPGNLAELESHDRYKFIRGDISNRELIHYIFEEFNIQGVIHFAAESHVDNSILGPEVFIKTNIAGTFTLIDVARNTWMDEPFKVKEQYTGARFHHISTDEVYGTLGESGRFKETTPYAPNSPYSASKASSDFIIRSYYHTYGMNVVTTNCSNNYGPKQHDEKLIPVIIRKALNLEPIPIYGDGKNVRDWLYVIDHCKGIDTVFHKGKSGETYNIGGECEKDNITVASAICKMLDKLHPRSDNKKYEELITFVKDRAGHDRRYAIDPSKIKKQLGWQEEENFESGITKTIEWYLQKYIK